MVNAYTPTPTILEKYASVLVNFALNSGKGINPGEVVWAVIPDTAKPFYGALQKVILKSGGQPMLHLLATGFDRQFYELASDSQLTFFPTKYLRERINLIDHAIGIIADHDLNELKGVNPQKMMLAAESKKPYRDWQSEKEYKGKFTWTLGLYATPALAQEAGLTLKQYWQQIIQACYLSDDDPISSWKNMFKSQQKIMRQLNTMPINILHVEAPDIDLKITLGEKRKFVGGSGRNVPSYELFTSPDWRGTNGYIAFNQPLYRYGNLIKNIRLEFNNGIVTKATATQNQNVLRSFLKRPNANKVGEFSLTDSRFSRITRFMANTLYDENRGGKYGNTHIAVGMSYKDAYDGDPNTVTKDKWEELGFVDSGEHTDIISTTNRTVTATMHDGSEKVIYASGRFVV